MSGNGIEVPEQGSHFGRGVRVNRFSPDRRTLLSGGRQGDEENRENYKHRYPTLRLHENASLGAAPAQLDLGTLLAIQHSTSTRIGREVWGEGYDSLAELASSGIRDFSRHRGLRVFQCLRRTRALFLEARELGSSSKSPEASSRGMFFNSRTRARRLYGSFSITASTYTCNQVLGLLFI